jgi:cytochrome c oxidase subunit IV
MSTTHPASERRIDREVRTYLFVWAALLALLVLTVASSFVHLGGWNAAVNVIIAGAKAALVAVFFMHLRERPALVRLAAVLGVVWLMILIGLSLSDFLTRGAG